MRGFMHILEILFRRGSLKIVCTISKLKKKNVWKQAEDLSK